MNMQSVALWVSLFLVATSVCKGWQTKIFPQTGARPTMLQPHHSTKEQLTAPTDTLSRYGSGLNMATPCKAQSMAVEAAWAAGNPHRGSKRTLVERSDLAPLGDEPVPYDQMCTHSEEVGSVLSASALVAGNMVGAGILALPSVSAGPGFIPSSLAMVGVWGYCLLTGLILAQLCCSGLAKGGGASIQMMARATLGPGVGAAVCAAFLASNYLLMVAYVSQGASLLDKLPVTGAAPEVCIQFLQQCGLEQPLAPLVFTGLAGGLCLWGPSKLVMRCNDALVALVGLSFAALLAVGMPSMDLGQLGQTVDPHALLPTLPTLLCALVFQNVVPVVSAQLGGSLPRTAKSLVLGTLGPLLMYIAWDAVILGQHQTPLHFSADGDTIRSTVGSSVQVYLGHGAPMLDVVIGLFSFAALVTSFWGASFSLTQELTSLLTRLPLRWDVSRQGPLDMEGPVMTTVARALTLGPPTLAAIAFPDIFLPALDASGTWLDPVLYGIVPAGMAWRMVETQDGAPGQLGMALMPKGRAVLAGVVFFTAMLMGIQMF